MEEIAPDLGSDEDLIVWLSTAADDVKTAQQKQDRIVRACRRRGIPWEKVARALGVSKQSAWGKYGERA